jgi:hypothetical protein
MDARVADWEGSSLRESVCSTSEAGEMDLRSI